MHPCSHLIGAALYGRRGGELPAWLSRTSSAQTAAIILQLTERESQVLMPSLSLPRIHADDQDKKTICLFWSLLLGLLILMAILANYAGNHLPIQSPPYTSRTT